MGRPGKTLHSREFWKKMGIIDLIGCECSKSLNPCHKPHKCLCFLKFMVYWATVASGFDSTTIASSNPFKSIGDLPLNLKGEERGLKILKVNVFWMLCWQLHFMKWLFYPPDIFFKNNFFLPQENQKIRNGIGTCRSGRALIFLQETSEVNENVLSWLISSSHQTSAGIDSENSWSFLSSSQEASALHGGNVTKARGTELPSREDPGMLKKATLCVIATLLTCPSLPENPCSAQNSNGKLQK